MRQGKLPPFPVAQESGEPLINPKPVTGLEAIGRGDDMNKLTEFIGIAQQSLGEEVMLKYINMEEALRRLAASASIDTTNLVKTPDQLQQEAAAAQAQQEQQMQQQQMLELAKSPAAAQIAKNYTESGATYGPQFPEGVDPNSPGATPNALPGGATEAGQANGPTPEEG